MENQPSFRIFQNYDNQSQTFSYHVLNLEGKIMAGFNDMEDAQCFIEMMNDRIES